MGIIIIIIIIIIITTIFVIIIPSKFIFQNKGSSIYYVITDRGSGQMITDYIGGEGSAETPKNDYVIYG